MTRLITVGHGTLPEDAFAQLLRDAGVELLVDVRAYPGSRRNPQFGRERLEEWLPAAGIDYRWEPRLGGRRGSPSGSSEHQALRNEQFRAYAEHMGSEGFGAALADVLREARARTVAVMCAEGVWWRCHRRLLADAATLLRGVEVAHLFHDGRLDAHHPTDAARVTEGRVVYDVGVDRELPGL